jgi:hypothetical protein
MTKRTAAWTFILFLTCGSLGVAAQSGDLPALSDSQGQKLRASNLNDIRYVTTAEDWHQTPPGTLAAGVTETITLSPCPRGIDGRDNYGIIYISDSHASLSEPVQMTGAGTCRSEAFSGTITLIPRNSHGHGYVIGSASSGIYEMLAAQRNNQVPGQPGYGSNGNGYIVTRPATGGNVGGIAYAYKVKGSIRIPLNNVFWDAKGTVLECETRDACVDVGAYGPLFLDGIRMVSNLDVNGWPISATECDVNNSSGFDSGHNGMTTITTTVPHAIQVGDVVDVLRTDNSHYWGGSLSTNAGVTRVAGVSPNKVYYPDHNCNNGRVGYPTTQTPGYINILNAPILDNNNVRLTDLDLGKPGNGNTLIAGHFNEGLTVLNDQAAIIDGFQAGALTSGRNSSCTNLNPYCGSLIYAPGPFINAAVLWIKHANLGLSCGGNGIWALNGNTVHISDSVVQGQTQFGMVLGNRRGGYGNVTLTDVYSEGGSCINPDFGANSTTGVYIYGNGKWTGGEGPQGAIPEFSSGGSTRYYYWLVVTDPTSGKSAPLYFGYGAPSGATQRIFWPRIPSGPKGAPTYTIIRSVNNSLTPTLENCLGGSTGACGVAAADLAQCPGLSCTFTDDLTAITTSAHAAIPANPTYIPDVMFWPGGLVLGGGGKFEFDNHNLLAGGMSLAGDAVPWASTFTLNNKSPNGYVQALGGNVTLLDENNSNTLLNTKGRIIIERPHGSTVFPGHFITLVDSDPLANLSSATKRANLSPSDTYLGNDVPGAALNKAGLAFGAPSSISQYIDSGPDGRSWQERLTSTQKEFKVPTIFDAPVSTLVGCNGCSPFSLPPPVIDDFNRAASGSLKITSRHPGATWIAAWDKGTQYVAGNVVTNAGTTYIAGVPSKNQAPPNQAYWAETSLGPHWTTLSGSWGILPGPFNTTNGAGYFPSNYASFTSLETETGTGRAYAYYAGGKFSADQYIQATMSPANSVIGICVRMAATKPLSAYCAVTGSGSLALAKFVKGVGSGMYTGAQIAPLSTVKLVAQASTITLYVNGVQRVKVDDASLAAGFPGLYGQNFVTPDNLIDDVYMGNENWSGMLGTTTGVYEEGVLNGAAKTYTNKQALTSGSATHVLANGFHFSSNTTFGCSCTDQTAPHACQAVPAADNTVTLAGSGSDVLWLSCIGH